MIIVAGAGDECVGFFIVMLIQGGSVGSYSQVCLAVATAAWLKMTFLDMHGCILDIHPHINRRSSYTDKQTHTLK